MGSRTIPFKFKDPLDDKLSRASRPGTKSGILKNKEFLRTRLSMQERYWRICHSRSMLRVFSTRILTLTAFYCFSRIRSRIVLLLYFFDPASFMPRMNSLNLKTRLIDTYHPWIFIRRGNRTFNRLNKFCSAKRRIFSFNFQLRINFKEINLIVCRVIEFLDEICFKNNCFK